MLKVPALIRLNSRWGLQSSQGNGSFEAVLDLSLNAGRKSSEAWRFLKGLFRGDSWNGEGLRMDWIGRVLRDRGAALPC